MKIINKEEFVVLRKLYQTLTVSKLKKELAKTTWNTEDIKAFGANLMNIISGFGSPTQCSLCIPVTSSTGQCLECAYRVIDTQTVFFPCAHSHKSYQEIHNARNIKELRKAIVSRVKYMLSIEKSWKKLTL